MDLTARLQGFATATLHDAAKRLGIEGAVHGLLPASDGARMVGRAVTVRYLPKGDATAKGLSLYDVIAAAGAGSILVVQLGANRWIAGSNLTSFAQREGLGGMLIDCCIRDVAEVRQSGFPVFSRGPSVAGYGSGFTLADTGGEVGCGGVMVTQGDYIVADVDGAFVLPAALAADIIYQAEEIDILDRSQGAGIKAGWSTAQLIENVSRWNAKRA